MDFAILVSKRGENYIVLYEGDYEQVAKIKDRITSDNADCAVVIRVDEETYREKKQYLEILNEYIESCIQAD